MPGESNETVFLMTIVHHTQDVTWSIEKTAAEFDILNNAIKIPSFKAFPKGMEFNYPEASYSSVFFGVGEEERIDRMVKLMMLQANVRLLIHDFLSMEKYLGTGSITGTKQQK